MEQNEESTFECRVCGWDSFTKREVEESNGIMGPGHEKQVLLVDYVCDGCHLVFTDPEKFGRWKPGMPFLPTHPDVRNGARKFFKINGPTVKKALKNLKGK